MARAVLAWSTVTVCISPSVTWGTRALIVSTAVPQSASTVSKWFTPTGTFRSETRAAPCPRLMVAVVVTGGNSVSSIS